MTIVLWCHRKFFSVKLVFGVKPKLAAFLTGSKYHLSGKYTKLSICLKPK